MTDAPRVTVPVEPTPKMLAATWDHEIDQKGGIESQNTRNARIWSAMLSAAPAPEGGAVMKACADFQEAIDYFEADVADAMAEESERADLWDREIMVNIDALKTVMNAALRAPSREPEGVTATREQIMGVVRHYASPAWCSVDRMVDALVAIMSPALATPSDKEGGE